MKNRIFLIFLASLVPVGLFYPHNFLQLILSVLLGVSLSLLLNIEKKNTIILATISSLFLIALAYILIKPVFFKDIIDPGLVNAQRGEHQNYQTNLFAKVLHNKASNTVFYLDNVVKQLSPSVIFASGHYPNFSKYIPIAYLFPWYLFIFLYSIKENYKKYLNLNFVFSLIIMVLLVSISTGIFNWFVVSGLLWFITFQTALIISKMKFKFAIALIGLNFLYLFLYVLPINYALYSSLFL